MFDSGILDNLVYVPVEVEGRTRGYGVEVPDVGPDVRVETAVVRGLRPVGDEGCPAQVDEEARFCAGAGGGGEAGDEGFDAGFVVRVAAVWV